MGTPVAESRKLMHLRPALPDLQKNGAPTDTAPVPLQSYALPFVPAEDVIPLVEFRSMKPRYTRGGEADGQQPDNLLAPVEQSSRATSTLTTTKAVGGAKTQNRSMQQAFEGSYHSPNKPAFKNWHTLQHMKMGSSDANEDLPVPLQSFQAEALEGEAALQERGGHHDTSTIAGSKNSQSGREDTWKNTERHGVDVALSNAFDDMNPAAFFGKNEASQILHWRQKVRNCRCCRAPPRYAPTPLLTLHGPALPSCQSNSAAFRALRGGITMHKVRTQRGHHKTHTSVTSQKILASPYPRGGAPGSQQLNRRLKSS